MITEKNNMHDIDTFMFFKWFFKAWVAVYLVTHTFDITMAVFDLAQHVVSGAAGVIGSNTNIDVDAALSSMQSGLDAMEIPELLLLVMEDEYAIPYPQNGYVELSDAHFPAIHSSSVYSYEVQTPYIFRVHGRKHIHFYRRLLPHGSPSVFGESLLYHLPISSSNPALA